MPRHFKKLCDFRDNPDIIKMDYFVTNVSRNDGKLVVSTTNCFKIIKANKGNVLSSALTIEYLKTIKVRNYCAPHFFEKGVNEFF